MSRLRLLLLGMHDCSRLLLDIAIYKESDAEKDKRNAEPLTHIQNHILLESYLRLLDELYQETHAEATDEESSDEKASVKFRQPVLVHKYLEDSQKEVA